MRGDILSMLRYEMKRRPDIAAVAERVADMTEEEIMAVPVPLPWFHIALKKLRTERCAENLAALIVQPFDASELDTTIQGAVYIYTGPTLWVKMRVGSDMETEIAGGSLAFWADDGRLWIGELLCETKDERITNALSLKERMTRVNYKKMAAAALEARLS